MLFVGQLVYSEASNQQLDRSQSGLALSLKKDFMTKKEKRELKQASIDLIRKDRRNGVSWSDIRAMAYANIEDIAVEQKMVFNDSLLQVFKEEMWNN